MWGVHREFAAGLACLKGTLTPPDTWSCSIVDLRIFYLLKPILFPKFRTCQGTFSMLHCTTVSDRIWTVSCNDIFHLTGVGNRFTDAHLPIPWNNHAMKRTYISKFLTVTLSGDAIKRNNAWIIVNEKISMKIATSTRPSLCSAYLEASYVPVSKWVLTCNMQRRRVSWPYLVRGG